MIPENIQEKILVLSQLNGYSKIHLQHLAAIAMHYKVDMKLLEAFCEENHIRIVHGLYDSRAAQSGSYPSSDEIAKATRYYEVLNRKRENARYVAKTILAPVAIELFERRYPGREHHDLNWVRYNFNDVAEKMIHSMDLEYIRHNITKQMLLDFFELKLDPEDEKVYDILERMELAITIAPIEKEARMKFHRGCVFGSLSREWKK